MALSIDQTTQAIIGLDFLPIEQQIAAQQRNDGSFIQEISDDEQALAAAGGYSEDLTEISLSLHAEPGSANTVVLPSLRRVLLDKGIKYYEIDILEKPMTWYRWLEFGYFDNYQVKIYVHGSLLAILVMAAIIAAIIAISASVSVSTWQLRLMKQETTTQLKISQDANTASQKIIDAMPAGAAKDAAQQKLLQNQLGLSKEASAAATKPPSEPKPDMLTQVKGIAIVAVVGLGIIALLNSGVLQSAAKAIPRRAGT